MKSMGDAYCCVSAQSDLKGDGDDANISDLPRLVDFIFSGS